MAFPNPNNMPTPFKSARKIITREMSIAVLDAQPVNEKLAVVSFKIGADMFIDLYNVNDPKVMANLLLSNSGQAIHAVIVPDSNQDVDNHPEIISADII